MKDMKELFSKSFLFMLFMSYLMTFSVTSTRRTSPLILSLAIVN